MSLPYSYHKETIWTTEDCEFFFTDIQTLCEWYSQPENHGMGQGVATTDFRNDDPTQYRNNFEIWFTLAAPTSIDGEDYEDTEFGICVKCHSSKLIQRKG